MVASRRAVILVTVRLLLLIIAVYSCLKPSLLGLAAFAFCVVTYSPVFCAQTRMPIEIASLTPKVLLSAWKKRKKQKHKSIKSVNSWFAAKGIDVLHRFQPVRQTNCVFAEKAKLWAAPGFDGDLDYYTKFFVADCLLVFSAICDNEELDGFVIEIPKEYCQSEMTFATSVNQILKTLASISPSGKDCMANPESVDRKGWIFEFNSVTFFITSFAPFYPPTHCRFGFGIKHGYILLQPEVSFLRNGVPFSSTSDHEKRTNIRRHISEAFRKADRPFRFVNPTASAAEYVVLDSNGNSVSWWLCKN